MKKLIITLIALALVASSSGQTEENRYQTEFPPINEKFISCFPDMDLVLREYAYIDEYEWNLIPQEVVAEFLPDFVYWGGLNATFNAVGKIINYKGLDLFIFDFATEERPDEDSYDNHTGGHRFLLLYKNGVPLTETPETGKEQRLSYRIDYYYYGEGGVAKDKSYFDTDTTIVSHSYISEEESATGYMTPIASTKEYRWTFNEKGEQEILEVKQLEYSSPFYDRNFMRENNRYWKSMYEEKARRPFPTKDEKWGIGINSFYYGNFAVTNPQVDLYFYVEKINEEYTSVFESYINTQLIDRYIVGEPRSEAKVEKNDAARTNILKCPIIIKTSDGDLEMLPNGKFNTIKIK